MKEVWRTLFALFFSISAAASAAADADPFGSALWPDVREEFFSGGKVVFDDRVKVVGPKFAEDSMNVPITVNADAVADIVEVVVVVDRNPIRRVLAFRPLLAKPVLSFRFKLQQSSPVRAGVRTKDGTWHVGGTWVDAAGGGCTLPGATRVSGSWVETLNRVQGRLFSREDGTRLRLRVMHPMDTGLVSGIPAFYIDELTLRDESGRDYMRIHTFEPVSENPVFSFDFDAQPTGKLVLSGRDNNGNRVSATISH